MIKAIHKVSTLLILAIGIIHTSCTFYYFHSLSEPAIWFAGTGLAGIFVALLNMGIWSNNASVMARRSVAAANFIFFFWLAASVSAIPRPSQVFVAAVGATMVISAEFFNQLKK